MTRNVLRIFNRQKTRSIDSRLLQNLTRALLEELAGVRSYEFAIHLVAAREMTRVNEGFLNHQGSTDVITFDNNEPQSGYELMGELFICIDDAIAQAKQFGATCESELLRYVVHGLLHLRGYDDLKPDLRRVMKRQENRLLKRVLERFPPGALIRQSPKNLSANKPASNKIRRSHDRLKSVR